MRIQLSVMPKDDFNAFPDQRKAKRQVSRILRDWELRIAKIPCDFVETVPVKAIWNVRGVINALMQVDEVAQVSVLYMKDRT